MMFVNSIAQCRRESGVREAPKTRAAFFNDERFIGEPNCPGREEIDFRV
jgi:hypothetical protein